MSNIFHGGTTAVDRIVGISDPNAGMQGEESAAIAQQQQALAEARSQLLGVLKNQNLLSPALLSSLGFTTNPDGSITDQNVAGGTMEGVFGGGPEQQQINKLLQQRQLAALEGNAPVDPQLERNLQLQEAQLRNQLQAQLGAGYETSTPGMQALADFRQRAAESRYNVGKDYLTTAAGLYNQGVTTAGNLQSQRLQNVFGVENMPATTMSLLTGNAAQYGAPVTEFGNIFGRQVGAQLTQEQTRQKQGAARGQEGVGVTSALGKMFA